MGIAHDVFAKLRIDIGTKLNSSAINLFLSILDAKEALLFLEKLKSANITSLNFVDFEDFRCESGHEAGHDLKMLPPGEAKLMSLGLTEDDIFTINQLGWDLEMSLSGWIFLRKNFDKAVKLVEELYKEGLKEWKKRREHSVGAEQNAFFEGLLPEDIRKATFYPETSSAK